MIFSRVRLSPHCQAVELVAFRKILGQEVEEFLHPGVVIPQLGCSGPKSANLGIGSVVTARVERGRHRAANGA